MDATGSFKTITTYQNGEKEDILNRHLQPNILI